MPSGARGKVIGYGRDLPKWEGTYPSQLVKRKTIPSIFKVPIFPQKADIGSYT